MYCTQCGTKAGDGARFCANCGRPIAGTFVAAFAEDSVYANFWLRLGAHLIDQAILTAASWVGMFALMMSAFSAGIGAGNPPAAGFAPLFFSYIWFWAFMIGSPWLYHALFVSSSRQATPGKMACGIKVTDLAGNRISFARATGRYFATWITNLTILIGYLMVAFTERRQALHDMIAKTVVVGAKVEPGRVEAAPPAQPMPGGLIAVVVAACLLPMIAILGILAAIAIPAYQDYSIRTQVSEGLNLASGYKAAVSEYVEANGRWPASDEDVRDHASLRDAVEKSRYVDSIEIWNGTVVITYGGQSNPRIQDLLLSVRPFVTEDHRIIWQCGNASVGVGDDVSPTPAGDGATDSATGVTSLVDRYLPASCRTGYVGTTEGTY